jgi:hypothetical protein
LESAPQTSFGLTAAYSNRPAACASMV